MNTGDLGHPLLQHFLCSKLERLQLKNNIKINRKVGIKKLKSTLRRLTIIARRKFGFNKKICRKLLAILFTCITTFCLDQSVTTAKFP
jgi:hypothetical protein